MSAETPCSIDGCNKRAHAHTYCSSHYGRIKRRGGSAHGTGRRETLDANLRMWERLRTTDAMQPGECWDWQGAVDRNGYGRSRRNGQWNASRAAWVEVNGSIPAGLYVCHHCDNPRCVRPSHLFLGTQLDNLRDMQMKGRSHGWRARLTGAEIVGIVSQVESGRSRASVARDLGVHPSTVARLYQREASKRGEAA